MKARISVLTAVMTLLVSVSGFSGETLSLGEAIPKADVEMKNVDGRKLTINAVKGEKGTLVIFSCNHCPFVKAWQDRIVRICNTYREKGVGVIMVNSNDPEKYPSDGFQHMKKQAEREGYEFPYVVDATSAVARAFGASRTPEAFLFDAAGKLVYHGAIDDNPYKPKKVKETYLRDALKALLAGNEIPVKNTRSVGCSIKYRRAGL